MMLCSDSPANEKGQFCKWRFQPKRVVVMEGTNVELTCECKEQIPKWEGAAWSAHFKNPEKVIDQWGLNSDKIDGFKGEKNFMISFKRPNDCKFTIVIFVLLKRRIHFFR